MTIRELIEILSAENPDETIMVASDAEGNDYRDIGRIEQEWNEEKAA